MEKAPVAAARTAHPPPPGKPTTLLDVHEVEWITRELERLLARETVGAGARRRRKSAEAVAASPEARAKKGGFLAELLGKHAASICGDGAVAGAVVGGHRRRGRGGFREADKV